MATKKITEPVVSLILTFVELLLRILFQKQSADKMTLRRAKKISARNA